MEEQKQYHPDLPGRIAAAQKVIIIAVSNGLDLIRNLLAWKLDCTDYLGDVAQGPPPWLSAPISLSVKPNTRLW